jgi:hypothetical protein
MKIDYPVDLAGIDSIFLVVKDLNGVKVICNEKIDSGTKIATINEIKISKQNYQTVQIGREIHIIDKVLASINHHCSPNIYIDTQAMIITAVKNIKPGDEITFFYPTTEWVMRAPFECRCGAKSCYGFISGAKDFVRKHPNNILLYNSHIAELISLNEKLYMDGVN